MGEAAARQLPRGRHFAVDEQGVGLRLTWRLNRGFVNLSLWRNDVCVETFHLTPTAAAEVIDFLARGLADAASMAASATVSAIVPGQSTESLRGGWSRRLPWVKRRSGDQAR